MESVEVKIDARAKRVINETSFAYLYVHFCDFIFFRNIYLLFFSLRVFFAVFSCWKVPISDAS